MHAGSSKYGLNGKLLNLVSEFAILVMKGLVFYDPVLSLKILNSKNTIEPYLEPATKEEKLIHEIRPKLKIKRKQEEEQTLLREKKKPSMEKLLLKFRKGHL